MHLFSLFCRDRCGLLPCEVDARYLYCTSLIKGDCRRCRWCRWCRCGLGAKNLCQEAGSAGPLPRPHRNFFRAVLACVPSGHGRRSTYHRQWTATRTLPLTRPLSPEDLSSSPPLFTPLVVVAQTNLPSPSNWFPTRWSQGERETSAAQLGFGFLESRVGIGAFQIVSQQRRHLLPMS